MALSWLRCRYGCAAPVVGVFHMPDGCACWPERVQALCGQHAIKVEPLGAMRPTVVSYEWLLALAGLHQPPPVRVARDHAG